MSLPATRQHLLFRTLVGLSEGVSDLDQAFFSRLSDNDGGDELFFSLLQVP
jgi:hypothetical protein